MGKRRNNKLKSLEQMTRAARNVELRKEFQGGLTQDNMGRIQELLDAKLKELHQETGVFIELGRLHLKGAQVTSVLEATVAENAEAKERMEWNQHSSQFGLHPKDFGRKFKRGEKTYKIVGIRRYADVNPIIAEDEAGVRINTPLMQEGTHIKDLLGK